MAHILIGKMSRIVAVFLAMIAVVAALSKERVRLIVLFGLESLLLTAY